MDLAENAKAEELVEEVGVDATRFWMLMRSSDTTIDFDVKIEQSEKLNCKIEMSLEGAFTLSKDFDEEKCMELVAVNGAAALIGIARGKIEAISASIFNNGKIVIPFINVIDYYKSIKEY